MADMSKIPGTPSFISANGGKSVAVKTDTQAADAEKAKSESKEDTKYTGGGEGSKG